MHWKSQNEDSNFMSCWNLTPTSTERIAPVGCLELSKQDTQGRHCQPTDRAAQYDSCSQAPFEPCSSRLRDCRFVRRAHNRLATGKSDASRFSPRTLSCPQRHALVIEGLETACREPSYLASLKMSSGSLNCRQLFPRFLAKSVRWRFETSTVSEYSIDSRN